jgi:diaminopimelate decarboxylase
VLVVRRDDDHDGQRPWRQALDHVEAAQSRHLEIQQHEVGLEALDLDEGVLAVPSLADHLDIRHRVQFVPQHLAGDRLVIHDQGAYGRLVHLHRS